MPVCPATPSVCPAASSVFVNVAPPLAPRWNTRHTIPFGPTDLGQQSVGNFSSTTGAAGGASQIGEGQQTSHRFLTSPEWTCSSCIFATIGSRFVWSTAMITHMEARTYMMGIHDGHHALHVHLHGYSQQYAQGYTHNIKKKQAVAEAMKRSLPQNGSKQPKGKPNERRMKPKS